MVDANNLEAFTRCLRMVVTEAPNWITHPDPTCPSLPTATYCYRSCTGRGTEWRYCIYNTRLSTFSRLEKQVSSSLQF